MTEGIWTQRKINEDTDYDINENYHEEMLKAKHGTCTSS